MFILTFKQAERSLVLSMFVSLNLHDMSLFIFSKKILNKI